MKVCALELLTVRRDLCDDALSSNTVESKHVWHCMTTLRQLKTTKIPLVWVPRYEDIAGNEATDSQGREGGQPVYYGPEPFCVVHKCYLWAMMRL